MWPEEWSIFEKQKVEIASWDKEKTRLQRKFVEKAVSSTFRRTQNMRGSLKTVYSFGGFSRDVQFGRFSAA